MSSERPSASDIKCALLWKICRRHGWSTPVSKDDLVTQALRRSEQGRGKRLVDHLLDEPYIGYQRGRGYSVRNNPDDQATAAFRLRDTCQYTEVQIEASLSRFEQAGGFDAYDRSDVFDDGHGWNRE